jgi:hypothetical protein
MVCPGVFVVEDDVTAGIMVRKTVRCGLEFVFLCMLVHLEVFA